MSHQIYASQNKRPIDVLYVDHYIILTVFDVQQLQKLYGPNRLMIMGTEF